MEMADPGLDEVPELLEGEIRRPRDGDDVTFFPGIPQFSKKFCSICYEIRYIETVWTVFASPVKYGS